MYKIYFVFVLGPPPRGSRSLENNQGPSQLHGHGPWLVCTIVLRVQSNEWGRISYLATTLNYPISVGGKLERNNLC
jgi:hypothetical protein